MNARPCPLCVRTRRRLYGPAHGRIRTPSVPVRLTSDDGRPPDRLFRACRPRRPLSKPGCRPLGGVTAAAIRNRYTSTAHTPPGQTTGLLPQALRRPDLPNRGRCARACLCAHWHVHARSESRPGDHYARQFSIAIRILGAPAEYALSAGSAFRRAQRRMTARSVRCIGGTLSLARNSQDPDDLTVGFRSLRRFLESMRVNGR